jgi:replication fork protection complex subunit Tof1/Swi1
LKEEKIMEFLLSLAASSGELEFRPWNTLLLEIFHLIFYTRSPNSLKTTVSAQQKTTLQDMLNKEKSFRLVGAARHSRFGGTFAIKTTVSFILTKEWQPDQY